MSCFSLSCSLRDTSYLPGNQGDYLMVGSSVCSSLPYECRSFPNEKKDIQSICRILLSLLLKAAQNGETGILRSSKQVVEFRASPKVNQCFQQFFLSDFRGGILKHRQEALFRRLFRKISAECLIHEDCK